MSSLKLNQILRQLLCELNSVPDHFEDQRRNIGKSYALSGEILTLTKMGVAALRDRDKDRAGEIECEIKRKFSWLLGLNVPDDIHWQFSSETGQEVVEFVFVRILYPVLFEGENVGYVPDFTDLSVTPQAYLAGLGDVPGELGKLLDDHLTYSEISREERLQLRRRFLQIATQIYEVMSMFETVYSHVINNTRRRGYGQSYRGAMGRVRGAIRAQQGRVLDMVDA